MIAHTISRIALVVTFCLSLAHHVAAADTIYFNATIHTVDEHMPSATAMLVRDGRIIAVGPFNKIDRLTDRETLRIDLGGRTVLPGLIDAHAHLAKLGAFELGLVDLSSVGTFDELVGTIAAQARMARDGDWILGGRWDHESWPSRILPTNERLSDMTPDHPVWLTRVDGHAGIANARALELAGIDRNTPDPAGGEILRDDAGDPTGVLVDRAMDLVTRRITASMSDEDMILAGQRRVLQLGLTGVHDAGVAPTEIETYRRLEGEGRLKLRVYAMIAGPYLPAYFEENAPTVTPRLVVRSGKLYIDGAMGSRGAWMLEPYADRPLDDNGDPYTGLALTPRERVEAITIAALEHGFQVCTHAIGDRGNREVLNAYARALMVMPTRDHRLRIEHAQLLNMADIPRFAAMGVVPSMQPTHCTSDMRWVETRVGPERALGAYAWSSLLKSGARIPMGSDFPVESPNPFWGIYSAITRQTHDGEPSGGWYPDERMTRAQALRAATLDAAWAAFMDGEIGSLTPGKRADFIVIDRDIMTCDAREIVDTEVLMTVIDGEVVWAKREKPGR